jgi:hypothetical protein
MKKPVSNLIGTITAIFTIATASAQTNADSVTQLLATSNVTDLNRIGLSYRMGINLNVRFHNLGAFPARSNPGPAIGGAVDRTYDDGYNLIDITGNNHGPRFENTTWNWGVNNLQTQVLPSTENPQTVLMHSVSSSGATTSSLSDDLQSGFELTYDRELLRKERWRLDFEAAFGYTALDISDNGPLPIGILQITDSYSVPPSGSGQPFPTSGTYSGSSSGPGAVIGSVPSRAVNVVQGESIGSRHFDADVFSFRLGPSLEFPLSKKVTAGLSGGFALDYVDSDFSFNETVSIPGVGSVSNAGSGSHSGWLPGGYVAGNLSVALSEKWALVAGAQFEDVGQYTQNLNGKLATLDLSKSIFVTIGLSYSF